MKLLLFTIFLLNIFISSSQTLIPYRKGNKWGYANNQLEIVIKPKYKSADFFYNDIARVENNKGKYAYINEKGELLCDFIYDTASSFKIGIAWVSIDSAQFCIDKTMKRSGCYSMCGGANGSFKYFRWYEKDGKFGLYVPNYNWETGQIIKRDTILPIWDTVIENYHQYAAVKKDSLWAIINTAGEYKTGYEFSYASTNRYNFGNYEFMIMKNGKYGFLNYKGELLIEPKYFKVTFFKGGYAKAYLSSNFWGYIDKKGQEYFKQNFFQKLLSH